jgi:hypothetical protein
MKTTTPSFKLSPTLMVAIISAWFAHPAWAVPIEPTLTVTEVSNTQLNWAWDAAGGSTSGMITTLTPDLWPQTFISGPNLNQSQGFGGASHGFWTEPGDPGFFNLLSVQYIQGNTSGLWTILPVKSDTSDTSSGFPIFPDGTVADTGLFKFAFVDSAAASETTAVPDTGTTASLFGLPLTGLAFLRRKLC